MLNLAEYRKKPLSLADYLPWACLVAPGVILNKDGSFLRAARYRGPDLDSATDAELVSITARLNNVLKRFGSRWAVFFEAERLPAQSYPGGCFADPVSWLVDEERKAAFEAELSHFESRYYVSFLHLPPADAAAKTEGLLYERQGDTQIRDPRVHLDGFLSETDRALALLANILPELTPLHDAEFLSYIHNTISQKRMSVAVPDVPAYLDAILCDTPLTGGVSPRLGSQHLRMLTVLGFPNTTSPGMLDALNDLGFSYRWVTRFIPLDKREAERELGKLRRQWFAKRKSVMAVVREVMFSRESVLIDTDAGNKAADADEALQELGSDDVAFGYVTTTIVVSDASERKVEDKLIAVERIVNARGFVTIRESLNAVEAWLGSLPGNPYANIRQPLVHTLNLAHMMPVSAVWAGPDRNGHLKAPPLMMTRTRGSTPFRLDLHVGDVGHSLVVGPTGAGKSVLLALLALQFRRFIGAKVIVFDKGKSAKAACLAMGGEAIDLSLDGSLTLQPLRHVDKLEIRAFGLDWVCGLLAQDGVNVDPEVRETVWTALESLASAPIAERTLTGLAVLIQSAALTQALNPYTLDGAFGRLLDGAQETIGEASVLHIELEELMQHKGLVAPVLSYLFHRLEARFDGSPTLLILDEAWLFLDHPLFAARIRNWLKTLRKKNVAVVFATQSLADIETSAIAPAIIESCMTRIFLPNSRAQEPQSMAIYNRFGLNGRQVEIIARAAPKRDYYLQSARGNRLFELGLGPIALSLCGASSPADLKLVDEISANHPKHRFASEFLKAKGLGWAAEFLDQIARKPNRDDGGSGPPTEPAISPQPHEEDDEQELIPDPILEAELVARLSPFRA
jgi:type IV secretion/conjugal transfer VirB4 family ATPase